MNISSLQIILPVGISFYTFQTLSYTIDVYRKKIEPTEDLIHFLPLLAFSPARCRAYRTGNQSCCPNLHEKNF